jgi:hypothetical protein
MRLSVSKAVSTKSVITPYWEVQMMIHFLSVKLDSISFPSMYAKRRRLHSFARELEQHACCRPPDQSSLNLVGRYGKNSNLVGAYCIGK